jgi:ABC-type sulfate/molybdate transport systems ATPase subunit
MCVASSRPNERLTSSEVVIRRAFKECTILTVAHRINTIMDADVVLSLEKGSVKEFDSPQNLLAKPVRGLRARFAHAKLRADLHLPVAGQRGRSDQVDAGFATAQSTRLARCRPEGVVDAHPSNAFSYCTLSCARTFSCSPSTIR